MKQISAQMITWDPREDETYLNGSQIKLTETGVSFKNELMSPGKALVTWHSQENYQASRRIPKLPLLQRNTRYHLKLKAHFPVQGTVYLKLSFYSHFGELIATEFIKEKTGSFVYPKDAYEYKLELINAGVKELDFEHLLITDESLISGTDHWYQKSTSIGDKVAVIFNEPILRAAVTVSKLKDVLSFSALTKDAYFAEEITQQIAKLVATKKQLAFVGNGPLSDKVALRYGAKYACPVFVTTKETFKTPSDVTVYYHDHKQVDELARKLYINTGAYDDLRVE